MALINEKSSFDAQNGTSTSTTTTTVMCNNQISNFYSQTLLLNNRIDFKSEHEFENDSENNEDSDDFCLSLEKLKNKYNVLQPTDSENKRPYINGYSPSIKIKMPSNNTNSATSPSPGQKQNILSANCFDGVELGEPKRILYPKENICLEWKKFSKIGAGLCNIGNTCFMNSVLQSLTYCPPLVNYLFSIKDEHPAKCKNRLQFCMICLMIKHVTLVLNNQNSVIKPIYICQRLKSIAKHFTFGRQEDAHEFLRYVIDHMWRSCVAYHEQELGIPGLLSKQTSDPLTKSTTAINHIFGGYCRSQVSCLQCKAKSNTYDYIMDFMLDIQNVSSLEEALRNFITPEILKNDNAYKCLKCKKSVCARKQFNVYRAPNVATFQFKRFDCNRMFGKIVKFISYPETLDLRPYMSENGPPLMYKLISVLVHHGNTCNSGHYYCYVKNSNKCWYMMNDAIVQQVGLNEVLNQKAYILFYIRQTDNNHSIKMNNNILSSPRTNPTIPNQTMPKIQSNKPKSDNSLTQNNNDISNNVRIFNPNFKFNLKPRQLQSTVVVHTPNQRSLLDENNNSLKYNGNNNHHNHSHSKENAIPNSATIMNDGVGSNKQSTTTLVLQNSKFNNNSKNEKEPLVPYENHDDDDNDDDSNSSTKHTPNRVSENIREKTITTAIPILKVKATTNSWRVVETSSIQSNNSLNNNDTSNHPDKNNGMEIHRKKPEANSNWKVIKTAITPEPSNHIILNGIKRKHQEDCDDEEYSHQDSKSDIKNDDNKTKKKEKKKKRKREKSKKRKRYNGSDMEIGDEDDDVELNWVERTKETLEMENHTNTNAPRKDLEPNAGEKLNHQTDGKKAKFVETSTSSNGGSNQKTDIIDALLKNASNGYGEVKSWNGGVSNLYKALNDKDDDRRKSNDDHYNDEYDQGKLSKIKNRNSDNFELLKCGANNPFQMQQKARYSNGNNYNDMRNNSAHKPYHHHHHKNHILTNGMSKFKFNFAISKKPWNDNNNFNFSSKKYYKNSSNNHHHNHRNRKSSNNFNSYDFKSR